MAELFDSDQQEKTESPSAHRREEFRRRGTVAMSKELTSVGLLFGVGMSFYYMAATTQAEFGKLADNYFRFDRITDFTKQSLITQSVPALRSWLAMTLPAFIVAVVSGLAICIAQVGLYVTWEPLSPNWDRINPAAGLKKLLSMQGAIEAVKSILKLAIASLVVWSFLKAQAPEVGHSLQQGIPEIAAWTLGRVGKLFFNLLFAFGALAAIDYGLQRYRVEKQMKTTRREAKDEMKLRDGDPLIKARIRGAQRRIAGKRMMEAVPKADVVVTNPTHFAVALQYDPENMAAPKVVAKGMDHVALKIREIAKANGVPLVENKPLARALYKEVEIGHPISRELFKAVAQVLAYVYRMRQMTSNLARS